MRCVIYSNHVLQLAKSLNWSVRTPSRCNKTRFIRQNKFSHTFSLKAKISHTLCADIIKTTRTFCSAHETKYITASACRNGVAVLMTKPCTLYRDYTFYHITACAAAAAVVDRVKFNTYEAQTFSLPFTERHNSSRLPTRSCQKSLFKFARRMDSYVIIPARLIAHRHLSALSRMGAKTRATFAGWRF